MFKYIKQMSAAIAVALLIIAVVVVVILHQSGYINLLNNKNSNTVIIQEVSKDALVIDDAPPDDPPDEPIDEEPVEIPETREDGGVILVPVEGLPERKKGFNEACEVQSDCASGLDCRKAADNNLKCLRRVTMDRLPGADSTPVPGTNLGEIEEGDRFFIRNRHYGRCIGRTAENTLTHSPVGYACKGEYKAVCNPSEDAPVDQQCSYGYVCAADATDGQHKCLLNPQMKHYTEENLPRKECKAWTIPCDTSDDKFHWTSISVPGTNKQKYKAVGTNQCLALMGHSTTNPSIPNGWRNHMYLTLQPCDTQYQQFIEWEKIQEPAESGVVNGEVFVPDPYYRIKSATPNDQCLRMGGWNAKAPLARPMRDTCERALKNSFMHFNFPIIES
jgi:hypothetical protein